MWDPGWQREEEEEEEGEELEPTVEGHCDCLIDRERGREVRVGEWKGEIYSWEVLSGGAWEECSRAPSGVVVTGW
jgi:hypothetical protein